MKILKFSSLYEKKLVWLLLLGVILTAAGFHRAGRFKERPAYDPQQVTAFFYTEGAFQYRYARMIADRESIPRYDRQAQWPEGIYPFAELTLLQQYLHGLTYRVFHHFFSKVPFHVYLIYFISFFSLLAIAALFAGARILGTSAFPALFCAVLYAFTGAAYARLQFYELEYTAFPLLAASFVLILAGLKREKGFFIYALVAGLLMALALAAWHFTRFYLLIFLLAYGFSFLAVGGGRERMQMLGIVYGFVLAAGLFVPVLRIGNLLLSPAVIFGGLLLAIMRIDIRKNFSFSYRLLLLLLAGGTAALLVDMIGGETAYGHVWALLKYKIIHLLNKPGEPDQLPFAARMLWQGPFATMSPVYIFYRFGLLLPLALLAGGRQLVRFRSEPRFDICLVLFMALFFFGLNIMVQRLTVFSAFFLSLVVAGLFVLPPLTPAEATREAIDHKRKSKIRRFVLVALLGGCLILQVGLALASGPLGVHRFVASRLPDNSPGAAKHLADELDMLAWIQQHTPAQAVFLTNINVSPALLTYANRSIVLHPKWETTDIRKKYEELTRALFGEDEVFFYRLLQKYQVDYYLYPVNKLLRNDRDSERYLAGLRRIPCPNLVYRLHFQPESLYHFQLVYRNRYYQVYRVVSGKTAVPGKYDPPYFPVYDEDLFRKAGEGRDCFFDDEQAAYVIKRSEYAIERIWQAGQILNQGEKGAAEALAKTAIQEGLPDGRVYYQGAACMMRLGKLPQAEAWLRRALRYDPDNTAFNKLAARLAVRNDDFEKALSILKRLHRQIPDDPEIHNNMGIIYWRLKRFAVARRHFARALALDPDYEKARHNLQVLRRTQSKKIH